MDDIFGRLGDRFPERSNGQNHRNPYASAYAPEYYYQPQSVLRSKPRTISVPISDPPTTTANWSNEHCSSTSNRSNDEKKAVVARPCLDESTAAMKIQNVFRGFSLRKSAPLKYLKIIAKVRAKSEGIRKHISDEKVVETVRRDEKERLKTMECIMSLLLKLDAIQGVNSVVREYRRAAARDLVNLQETVDAIISGKPMEEKMHKGDTMCSHTEDKHDLQVEGSCETEEFCSSQSSENDVELEKVRHNTSWSDNVLIVDVLETEPVQCDENMKAGDKIMEDDEVVDATGTEDTFPTKEKAAEDFGMVTPESKRLKTMVDDLLMKSEKQSQMINNLSCRIAQLEDQVSSKKKFANQRNKTRVVTNVASQICGGDGSENVSTD